MVLAWVVLAVPLRAQSSATIELRGTKLTPPVQETLARLQDQWLSWNGAFLQDDPETAERAVADLLATASDLGMESIPDLSVGAVVRAVDIAREGDRERAGWALAMADRLDPNRPETAFGASQVSFLEGSYVDGFRWYLIGYYRLFFDSFYRQLWLHNVLLWALTALLVGGGFFIALLFSTRGSRLYRDLAQSVSGFAPGPAGHIVALVVLAWPFLLPQGWIWLLLYWAALLWGYGSRSERWMISIVCVLCGISPLVVLQQQKDIGVVISEQMRVVDALAQKRLYGRMFYDVGLLRATMTDSIATDQLIADVHLNLGQDDVSLPFYRKVVEAEPENAAALNNLGTYHFVRREFIRAIEFFQKATEADPQLAAAYYNMAQSYQALLEFGNADTHMASARQADADAVSRWVADSRVMVNVDGGIARRKEIRAALDKYWLEGQDLAGRGWFANIRSALLSLFVLFLAFLLHRVRGKPGAMPLLSGQLRRTAVDRWLQRLVPGLPSAEDGDGVRSFAAALATVSLLTMPLSGILGYRLPWGYEPGSVILWSAVLLGLLLFMAMRWRRLAG